MLFLVHTPGPPLHQYIENIVFYEGYKPEHTVEKLLPDGSINVIIDFDDTPKKLFHNDDFTRFTEFEKSFISGQHKNFIHIDAVGDSKMVVRFRMGGAWPFLDFPVSYLNNRVRQLDDLWDDILDFRSDVFNEKDPQRKFKVAEKYFLSRLKPGLTPIPAIVTGLESLQKEGQVTTKDLAAKAGVSQKHLIALFDRYVGLTPKYLARIFRFQKVLQQIEEQQKIEWTKITYDCGYYDQAHFIRDFSAFSGINPSQYLTEKGEYLNYIPVTDKR